MNVYFNFYVDDVFFCLFFEFKSTCSCNYIHPEAALIRRKGQTNEY